MNKLNNCFRAFGLMAAMGSVCCYQEIRLRVSHSTMAYKLEWVRLIKSGNLILTDSRNGKRQELAYR